MSDKEKGFVFYYDYSEHLELLTDAECGQLIKALCDYGRDGKQSESLTGMAKMAFSFIKKQIDRDAEKYNRVVEKRREAGKKGGRPPKTSKANGLDEKAKKANGFCEKQSKAKKPNTNTNTSTSINTNTNTVIKKEVEGERKKTTVEYTNDFNVFWSTYPKKIGKGEAFKAFQKINPDVELLNKMLNAVNTVRHTEQWQRDGGRYIPNPSTWLNQRRWEDEPITAITHKSNAELEAEKRNAVIDNALTEDMERDDFDIYEYYAQKL